MGHAIPKIEYLNVTKTGDTHSNTTVDNLSSMTGLAVGMTVTGSGIPTGTKIAVVGVSSITLDTAATTSLVATSLDFAFLISFDYPPIELTGEKYDADSQVSVSISGVRQTSTNYIEALRDLKFSHVSQTIKTLVDTFMTTHALLGLSFRYFDDKTSMSYLEYELKDQKYLPEKIAARGVTNYVWRFGTSFRRAL